MTILDGLKAELAKLDAAVQKDEKWVIAEIQKGWALLQAVGHTAEVDIQNIFNYVKTHQSQILGSFHAALGALTAIGALIPGAGAASAIATALTAINAATAATNVLGNSIINGSTPLSTAVSAVQALKDAQSAVNAVVTHSIAKPVAPAAVPVAAAA